MVVYRLHMLVIIAKVDNIPLLYDLGGKVIE